MAFRKSGLKQPGLIRIEPYYHPESFGNMRLFLLNDMQNKLTRRSVIGLGSKTPIHVDCIKFAGNQPAKQQ